MILLKVETALQFKKIENLTERKIAKKLFKNVGLKKSPTYRELETIYEKGS